MADVDLTQKLLTVLKDYNDQVANDVDAAAEKCAKGLAKDLRSSSPKRKGNYRKSWTNRPGNSPFRGNVSQTVYNRKHYQLTHLLEHGHGGPAPAPPHVHIEPLEKKWTNEFEKLCEEACKG